MLLNLLLQKQWNRNLNHPRRSISFCLEIEVIGELV